MKHIIRLLALLGILVALLAPLVAYADLTHPNTLEIEAVRCWRHMLEPDDVLMIARYNAAYGNLSTQPYQDISQTFYFTYTDSTGNVTGNETAYPYFNLGYVKGLVAFYWAADDEDKPDWGDLGNITVTGTSLFDSPPTDTLTLIAADWATGTQPSTMREDLRQWLINQLIFLELDWNNWCVDQGYTDRQVTLVGNIPETNYQVAMGSGEAYLNLSIPNIRTMCKLLFMDQDISVTHTEHDWSLSQQTIFENLHQNDVIGNATEGMSQLLGGIGKIWASTLVVLIGCFAIIALCTIWGRLNNGLLIAYTIILLSTPEGLFQMGLMGLFAMIAVLSIADIFVSKRQSL